MRMAHLAMVGCHTVNGVAESTANFSRRACFQTFTNWRRRSFKIRQTASRNAAGSRSAIRPSVI